MLIPVPQSLLHLVQVIGIHFKTAYTKQFLGGPLVKWIANIHSFISFYLILLLFSLGFCLLLKKIFRCFILKPTPRFIFYFPLPHLLHYYDNSYSLHQLSLKGPVAIIFLVWLCADYESLLPSSVSQPGLPICFHSNEVVEKKLGKKEIRWEERREGWEDRDERRGKEGEWTVEERGWEGEKRGAFEQAVKMVLKKTFQ